MHPIRDISRWPLAAMTLAILAACGGGHDAADTTAAVAEAETASPQPAESLSAPGLGITSTGAHLRDQVLAAQAASLRATQASLQAFEQVARPNQPPAGKAAATKPTVAELRSKPRQPQDATIAAMLAGRYIVQLAEKPAASYDGGLGAYAATAVPAGRATRFSAVAGESHVQSYQKFLSARHDSVAAAVGAKKLASYTRAFNGFTARLSPEQAAQLKSTDGVLSVTPVQLRQVQTDTTALQLGLQGAGGVWDKYRATGEDMIIGVLDTGIMPEHPSFSDLAHPGNPVADPVTNPQVYKPLPAGRFKGSCEVVVDGVGFGGFPGCNNKLVGARFYGIAGYTPYDLKQALWGYYEDTSVRDHHGHGTHTSSTAAGNSSITQADVMHPSGYGVANVGSNGITGMAPRARLAMYKVCYNNLGCLDDAILAAIDDAVADGVDVINYSIGSIQTDNAYDQLHDPVQAAFRHAAAAGVFVSVSAGNDGGDAWRDIQGNLVITSKFNTAGSPGPWLTTVAAGSKAARRSSTATLSDGTVYQGRGAATSDEPALPIVLAREALNPFYRDAVVQDTDRNPALLFTQGMKTETARLCRSKVQLSWAFTSVVPGPGYPPFDPAVAPYPPILDPDVVRGKYVVCEWGYIDTSDLTLSDLFLTTSYLDMVEAAKEAGAAGVIIKYINPARAGRPPIDTMITNDNAAAWSLPYTVLTWEDAEDLTQRLLANRALQASLQKAKSPWTARWPTRWRIFRPRARRAPAPTCSSPTSRRLATASALRALATRTTQTCFGITMPIGSA